METGMETKRAKGRDVGEVLKEAGILFAITVIAGLLLGFVYELTREPIAEQERKAVQEACREVFQDASAFEAVEYVPSEGLQEQLAAEGVISGSAYRALDSDGNLLGYVVESISKRGYGGRLVLYAGVTLDGTFKGVSILEISETPGLGMRAEEVLVPQVRDKKVYSFTYTKTGAAADNEIDAITNATVTTRAFTNAVNGALYMAWELNAQEGGSDE